MAKTEETNLGMCCKQRSYRHINAKNEPKTNSNLRTKNTVRGGKNWAWGYALAGAERTRRDAARPSPEVPKRPMGGFAVLSPALQFLPGQANPDAGNHRAEFWATG